MLKDKAQIGQPTQEKELLFWDFILYFESLNWIDLKKIHQNTKGSFGQCVGFEFFFSLLLTSFSARSLKVL